MDEALCGDVLAKMNQKGGFERPERHTCHRHVSDRLEELHLYDDNGMLYPALNLKDLNGNREHPTIDQDLAPRHNDKLRAGDHRPFRSRRSIALVPSSRAPVPRFAVFRTGSHALFTPP